MAALVERLVEACDGGADGSSRAHSSEVLCEVDGVLDAALRHVSV